MRLAAIVSAAVALGVCAGCVDDDGYDCGMQTTGIAGVAPDCMVWLRCQEEDEWQLDCGGQSSGDGMCVCYTNGEPGDSVPYQDDFCPPDHEGDMDAYVERAAKACGDWPQ